MSGNYRTAILSITWTPRWQKERQTNEGERQAADGAEGEGVPEDFVRAVEEEGDKAEGGGKDGQERGDNFMIEGLDEGSALGGLQLRFLNDVDSGVDDQAGEHHERGEATLIEGGAGGGEDEEAADERYWDQADDGKR